MLTQLKVDILSKSILIVDDSRTNILLLESMLENRGYTSVYSCLSAKEAYNLLDEFSIDIILLDVNMPGIDGIEACKTIKKIPKHKQIPIIMVTADDSDKNLEDSFNAGASDFVTKPVNFITLSTRMKNLFLLKEKDKLILNQTRSSAMSEIIEVLAHQWRQPLAAISSTAINIQVSKELDNLSDTELNENMSKINKYALELSKTINEIRDISKQDKLPQESNINDLINKAINFIKKSYSSKDIEITSNLSDIKNIKLCPNEFVRVLLNILLNSQEAFLTTAQDIEKRKIHLTSMQNNNTAKIIIKDNAGGINEKDIKKVFDPYFSTKKEKNGTGLGLYSCKQIIKEHLGGKIEIDSKNGETVVSICLRNDSDKFK